VESLSQERRSTDAERLGLYTLLANLEAEWAAWSKNILLYPVVIGDALCIAKAKVREQISTFEKNEVAMKEVYPVYPVGVEQNKAS
jgi:hypothetical protein